MAKKQPTRAEQQAFIVERQILLGEGAWSTREYFDGDDAAVFAVLLGGFAEGLLRGRRDEEEART
jgi:hypothetical protein